MKSLEYSFYALAVAVFFASLLSLRLLAIALSFILLVYIFYFSTASHKDILPFYKYSTYSQEALSLDKEGTCVLKKEDPFYVGVSAILLRPGSSISSSQLESVFSNANVDFDYVVRVRQIDARRFIEGLETRKRLKEIAIAKSSAKDYNRINVLKKELEIIKSELESVTKSKPVELRIFLRIFSKGPSTFIVSKEARDSAISLGNSLALLGFSFEQLWGKKLLEAVE